MIYQAIDESYTSVRSADDILNDWYAMAVRGDSLPWEMNVPTYVRRLNRHLHADEEVILSNMVAHQYRGHPGVQPAPMTDTPSVTVNNIDQWLADRLDAAMRQMGAM